jgi:hypothetical protein
MSTRAHETRILQLILRERKRGAWPPHWQVERALFEADPAHDPRAELTRLVADAKAAVGEAGGRGDDGRDPIRLTLKGAAIAAPRIARETLDLVRYFASRAAESPAARKRTSFVVDARSVAWALDVPASTLPELLIGAEMLAATAPHLCTPIDVRSEQDWRLEVQIRVARRFEGVQDVADFMARGRQPTRLPRPELGIPAWLRRVTGWARGLGLGFRIAIGVATLVSTTVGVLTYAASVEGPRRPPPVLHASVVRVRTQPYRTVVVSDPGVGGHVLGTLGASVFVQLICDGGRPSLATGHLVRIRLSDGREGYLHLADLGLRRASAAAACR